MIQNYNVSQTAGVRTGFAYINQMVCLNNDDLRKAVLTAIDDDTMCNTTVGGLYTPGSSVFYLHLQTIDHDKLKDTIPFDDSEKAKKILDDAGIVDSNKDGYQRIRWKRTLN